MYSVDCSLFSSRLIHYRTYGKATANPGSRGCDRVHELSLEALGYIEAPPSLALPVVFSAMRGKVEKLLTLDNNSIGFYDGGGHNPSPTRSRVASSVPAVVQLEPE